MLIYCFMLFGVAAATCPDGQVWHTETSFCCGPTYDCDIDSEVIICKTNGTSDECIQCGSGRTNGFITSSLDYKDHRCFSKTKDHNNCPIGDTEPIPTAKVQTCGLPCRCRHEECYYGDPCLCTQIEPCGINEELDPETGVCVACSEGRFKLAEGCGPCLTNTTAFELSPQFKPYKVANKSDDKANVTYEVITDGSPEDVEPEDEQSGQSSAAGDDSDGMSMVAVILVIVILLAVGILIAAVLIVVRRQLRSGNTSSRLVVCYYKLTGTQLPQQQDEENAAPAPAPAPAPVSVPVQEVTPMVHSDGASGNTAEEPRLETLKSEVPEPDTSEEHNTTTTPLIGGTTREDDETEQKTKEL